MNSKMISSASVYQNSYVEILINKDKIHVTAQGATATLSSSVQKNVEIYFINTQFINDALTDWTRISTDNGSIKLIPPYGCTQLVLRFSMIYGRINEDLKIGDPNGPSLYCK